MTEQPLLTAGVVTELPKPAIGRPVRLEREAS
jgi:hypothetical protein